MFVYLQSKLRCYIINQVFSVVQCYEKGTLSVIMVSCLYLAKLCNQFTIDHVIVSMKLDFLTSGVRVV